MERQTKPTQWTLITSLVILATAGQVVWGQYAGGSGTADDPYLIATAEQLNAIGLHPEDGAKHFRLTADIDMNDLGEAPVNLIPEFQGVFDGNDHTIANLTYLVKDEDSPPEWHVVVDIGLFRVISGWDALVTNLRLTNPDVRPDPTCARSVDRVGALAGLLDQGWVRNCYVEGGHVRGDDYVGGLVGECWNNAAVSECWSTTEVSGDLVVGGLVGEAPGAEIWLCHVQARVSGNGNVGGLVGFSLPKTTIEDCFTTGDVTGNQAGGLVGFLEQGRVSNCYSTASLSGAVTLGGLVGVNHGLIHASWAGGKIAGGTQVGGLVGYNVVGDGVFAPYFDAKVTDSYATGAVRGDNMVGGLIAVNEGTLLRCYSTGAVTTSGVVPASNARHTIGGLVATDRGLAEWDIRDCFWDTTASGVNISRGGTGKTTVEMQAIETYLDAGWDFAGETANGAEDLWKMRSDEPGYPKLAWEEEAPTDDPPDPNAPN